MNQKRNELPEGFGANPLRRQQTVKPQPHKPLVIQPMMATTLQMKKPPVAPPVYRPQPVPRVLQTKSAVDRQSQAGSSPRQPVAPPAYRPQPVPRVLQTKNAAAQTARAVSPPFSLNGQGNKRSQQLEKPNDFQAKPRAHRPAVCQFKAEANTGSQKGVSRASSARPSASPHKPQSVRSPHASNRRANVVQGYIPVKYLEWKQVNSTKSIKDYVALVKNERKHAEASAEDEGTKLYSTNLTAEAQEFDQAYASNNQKAKKSVVRALDRLVDRINLVLAEAHTKGYVNEFAKAQLQENHAPLPVTDWETGTHTGVIKTFSKLVALNTGTVAVSGHGNPNVPVVPYSRAKLYLPWSTCALIQKIYKDWLTGTPLDMRTVDERGDRQNLALPNPSVAVSRPGTMRSWHQDAHGLLPAIPDVDQPPVNIQNFDAYARRYSGTPNNMGNGAVPSGYIEYTGTGHGNDYANFRLLLDYKQGLIYICYHYQLWSNGNNNPQLHGQNPADHQDKNNPWINIKMNA